jgi:hypothetical protein
MPPTFPPGPGAPSPWGDIQTVTPLGADAVSVTTASHGGLCVSPAALCRIPEALRRTAFSAGGWFEEDCDWAIPYLALGLHAFEGDRGAALRMAAVRTVRRWHAAHAEALGVGPAQDASDGCDEGRAEAGERKGGPG